MTMAIDEPGAAFRTTGSQSEPKTARRHVFKVKLEVVQKDKRSINITAVIHKVICSTINPDKSIVLFDMQGASIDASKFLVHEIMRAICRVLWLFNCWTFQVSLVICTDSFIRST